MKCFDSRLKVLAGTGGRRFALTLVLAGSAMLMPAARGWSQTTGTGPATRPAGSVPTTAPSKPPADVEGPRVFQMTVHAKATTQPALEYELLPDVMDQTPGNAADLYMLTFLRLEGPGPAFDRLPEGQTAPSGMNDRISLYLELSPEQLLARRKEVEEYLRVYESYLHDAEIAGWRERCHWDLPVREEAFELQLPHLSRAGKLANLLSVRARFQIATEDWAGAHRTLQTGFALAHALSEEGPLIQNLVGAGAASALLYHGVGDWQRHPGAPNLYWGLAGLPHPFTDLRRTMRWERAALSFTFPQLKKLRTAGGDGQFTEADWQDFISRLGRYVNDTHFPVGPKVGGRGLPPIGAALLLYPQAKKQLVQWGWDERQVQELPVGRALAEYEFGDYRRAFDEELKWLDMPFCQAYPRMVRATRAMRAPESGVVNPLLSFVPSVGGLYFSVTRFDREIAAAQTIEALRDYAARHEGRVPDKLDQLIDAPAPLDPITGKPFEYTVDRGGSGDQGAAGLAGTHITLNCPPPSDPPTRPGLGLRYEVTIVTP